MRKRSRIKRTFDSPQIQSNNPFSQERLNDIFKVSKSNPDRLISRENSWLEFKQTFNWKSRDEYARTFAAFGNTQGGYMIFGVGNKPHTLIGQDISNFEKTDPAIISSELNNFFAPEIAWDSRIYDFQEKSFVIFYIHESQVKPIIATKNGEKINEGAIYYRYRGRTERIKYPELRRILDEQRQKEQEIWLKHLFQINKIGVENVGILDIKRGIVSGSKNAFFIDESLLPKLSFIKEGQFSQVEGAPTLKLVGDVKPINSVYIQPTSSSTRIVGIRSPDIIENFLDQNAVQDPLEYIKQISFEPSSILPIYYYISLAKFSISDTIELLKKIQSRSPSKERLIVHLEKSESFVLEQPKNPTENSIKKQQYKELILKRQLADIEYSPEELRLLLQSVRLIPKERINPSYLLPLLKKLYEKNYTFKGLNVADNLRRSICYVDYMLYRHKIKEKK